MVVPWTLPFTKWCCFVIVLIKHYVRLSGPSWFQKTMIMYMQSILDKMDALQNGYGFWGLVSRTYFHLIKCLCGIDHFVGYSPSNSSHFISLVFCSELAANCLICLLQQKKSRFFCVTFALNIDVYVTFTYCMFYLLPNVIYFLKLSSF